MVRGLRHPNNVLVGMRIIEILTHIFSCGLKLLSLGPRIVQRRDLTNEIGLRIQIFPFAVA